MISFFGFSNYPQFQCPKCKGYHTEDRGKEGLCWDCHTFFIIGEQKVNWWAVKWFLILFIIGIIIAYFAGVFN